MPDAGTIERVYYAVPSHYTIGEEFPGTLEGHAEACAFARAKIERFDYASGPSYSRAFVDKRFVIRWLPESGQIGSGVDMIVERVEIFLTDAEKAALGAVV
jgi:hypothetical protein